MKFTADALQYEAQLLNGYLALLKGIKDKKQFRLISFGNFKICKITSSGIRSSVVAVFEKLQFVLFLTLEKIQSVEIVA